MDSSLPSAVAARPARPTPRGEALGWLALLGGLLLLAALLPPTTFSPGHKHFLLAIGLIGVWRYTLGFTHFSRALLFLYWTHPRARRAAAALGEAALPSHVYLLVTSFRIDAATTAAVYRAVIAEAVACGRPATVVASIVELADQGLITALWQRLAPPERVCLRLVRIPGTGKRDGLAQGFRAISRDLPDDDAVVAVVDGDTVLQPGVVRQCAPYLKLFPNVGGLTTNEHCRVDGSRVMSDWHQLRFAQRHLNMCSMALSKRVLTLTGRMSMFRASVVVQPGFIADVEHDALDHWRLGRFKFLTGDDKSSWYSLMRLGYDTYYVPEADILTVEHPPDRSFWKASRQLMFRWYGNSLRQNSRATRLGWRRLGSFTSYVLWDQRIGMWTSLLGLTAALIAAIKYGPGLLLAYLLWVGLSRTVMSLMLIVSGHRIGPAYPVLLYYNQIVGALTKIKVFFHLDQQSWTRQKTSNARQLDAFQRWFNPLSSRVMLATSSLVFVTLVAQLV
ncbi:MAG: glycosyltransferase family 2 protein [Stagnimonas sp.]|nr:glycosyltransferase family 2 protein [Stagnimonas sp.]